MTASAPADLGVPLDGAERVRDVSETRALVRTSTKGPRTRAPPGAADCNKQPVGLATPSGGSSLVSISGASLEFDLPSFIRRLTSALLCAVVMCLLPVSPSFGTSAPAGFKPFAPDSIWNLGLRDDAPLDARSGAYAAWLDDQVQTHGAWLNTTSCSMPTYWADASTPTVPVVLSSDVYQDPALLRAWSAVPIPSGATPSNCADRNFAVIQRQPDGTYKEWEFFAANKRTDGSWVARWGGVTQDVAADSGVASSHSWRDSTAPTPLAGRSRAGWHVTASSISMIAGVITARDVERGRIEHALSIAIPRAAQGRWLWPAQRTDGSSADLDALPEGAHLRLDPTVDVASISMVPLVRMMAEAAQKYGIVVRDQTWDSAVFYTEEVRPGEVNPFTPLLNGMYADRALEVFPWASLQVLRAPTCRNTVSCEVTEQAVINLLSEATTPRVGESLTLDTTNSTLNQPRTKVEWDLYGDGTYETQTGRNVKVTYVPAASGSRIVRVRITTRSGTTVAAERTLNVAAAQSEGGPDEPESEATLVTPSPGGEAQAPTTTKTEHDSRMTQWETARRMAAKQSTRFRRAYHKQLNVAEATYRAAHRR